MECTKCKYEVLFDAVHLDWQIAYDGDYEYSRTGGYPGSYKPFKRQLANGAEVETTDKHDKTLWGPGYGGDYDEYPQGTEFDAWVILKVTEADGTVLFFRKSGTANSYGNVSWDGLLQEVKAVKKEVTVFENLYEAV